MAAITLKQKHRRRFGHLKEQHDSWRGHYLDIQRYLFPRRGRYLHDESVAFTRQMAGGKRHQHIINGSAGGALNVLAAGMQGGLTSPAQPWFSLTLADEQLMEYSPVKSWLHDVRNLLLLIYSRSNFYSAIFSVYTELAAFGTAVLVQTEDWQSVVRFRPLTVGEYYLAADDTCRVDTLYRRLAMTAGQMVSAFGLEKVSDSVRRAYHEERPDEVFEVRHCVHPVDGAQQVKQPDMAYASVYYEDTGPGDRLLRESRFRGMPFVAPRWDITGDDVYGSSPAMSALGDIKMLQRMEKDKLKALTKMVDPPMNADASLKQEGGTVIAGGVNYVANMGNSPGPVFAPSYQVNPDMRDIAFETDRIEQRIRRFFYNDLFLSILQTDKPMTATEVAERHEEKLMMIGPVIERLQAEMLDPIIDRTFDIAGAMGLVPEPPAQIQGLDIDIEYMSLLAQAQKLVGTVAIEQTVNFAGGLAAVNPEVIDKIDFDEAIDQYAHMVGVPPKLVRGDDAVEQLRAARQQAMAAEQARQTATEAITGAKQLSETKLDEGSALDALMGGAASQ